MIWALTQCLQEISCELIRHVLILEFVDPSGERPKEYDLNIAVGFADPHSMHEWSCVARFLQ